MIYILSRGDRGKAPASDKFIDLVENVISDVALFYSSNPLETARKATKKLNMELLSLLKV